MVMATYLNRAITRIRNHYGYALTTLIKVKKPSKVIISPGFIASRFFNKNEYQHGKNNACCNGIKRGNRFVKVRTSVVMR
jgi:hypothetical protein